MSELYRRNVGIVVFNQNRKVLWCERKDLRGQWQFPQGGIEKGETFVEAAKRELKEETSVVSVKVEAVIEEPIKYDFPPAVSKKFAKKGQAMNWVLFEFVGDEAEINLKTATPEFVSWKWIDIDDTVDEVVNFKRGVYQKMVKEFKPYLEGKKR